MMRKVYFFVFFVASYTSVSAQKLIAEHLRCEYQKNPIGLDIKNPSISWRIAADTVQKNILQTAYQIQVVANEPNFSNSSQLVWDSKKVSAEQNLYIQYAGKPLQAKTRYYWRVKVWDNHKRESVWTAPAFWEIGLMDPSNWTAKWITAQIQEKEKVENPLPMFRKSFNVAQKIRKARLYITSQGLYQASINGKLVTENLFTPGWTSYNKRTQYQVYDVTSLVNKGKNVTGVTLGDGWFRGEIGFNKVWYLYGMKLALLYQLEIEYENGEKATIISDESWKANTGAIQSASIFHGTLYDANKEINGWNTIGIDDQNWKGVTVENYPKNHIVQTLGEPVKRIQEVSAAKQIITPKKELVFDFGQNLTGRVRFNLKGKKGDTITILHAEVLDKAGNFYTDNLRGAKQEIRYIFKGDQPVVFEPEFTYQGFRYIKILDFKGKVSPSSFTAIVIHSDMESTGEFVTSDALINQLHSNIRWGMQGNFLDVPTDCPQRNERLGWTGDVQAFSSTSNFLFNTNSFYRKWLEDLKADQLPNGSIGSVVPTVFKEYGNTGWGDVATVLPFNLYQSFGDRSILERQYNSMKAWVDYLKKQMGADFILRTNSKYADWLFFIDPTDWNVKPGFTDKDLIATAFLAHSSQLLAKSAQVMGKTDDFRKYNELFIAIKTAFQKEYMTTTGRLSSNSQTAYAMALSFDLLPENQKTNALNYLIDDIKSRKYHLSTGFLGTPLLCHALSENGANNVAYQLFLQKTYPSWLYPVTKGATTIWERWDGIKPDGTFQTIKMNSFNHYAYGAIGSWMYEKVAGFQTDEKNTGYKHIILRPLPDSSLQWIKASYVTSYGLLQSQWRRDGNHFRFNVTVPSNTTATIYLPYSKEVKEVGSGKYEFNYLINE